MLLHSEDYERSSARPACIWCGERWQGFEPCQRCGMGMQRDTPKLFYSFHFDIFNNRAHFGYSFPCYGYFNFYKLAHLC